MLVNVVICFCECCDVLVIFCEGVCECCDFLAICCDSARDCCDLLVIVVFVVVFSRRRREAPGTASW